MLGVGHTIRGGWDMTADDTMQPWDTNNDGISVGI